MAETPHFRAVFLPCIFFVYTFCLRTSIWIFSFSYSSIFDSVRSHHIGYLYLITGTCFTFLIACLLSNANTISEFVQKPISLFQLSRHLQWHRPINCCFIFLPQFGQTRLLLIGVPPAERWKRQNRKYHIVGATPAP